MFQKQCHHKPRLDGTALSVYLIFILQKFKNELKKNREKVLGESSSKNKKKEVLILIVNNVLSFY